MSVLLPLVLSLVAPTEAGEILVNAATPVVIAVDGTVLRPVEDSTAVVARDLAGGAHRVEVRDVLGTLLTAADVEVPVDQQVRLQYARKRLTVIGSGQLPGTTPPVVALVEVPVPETHEPFLVSEGPGGAGGTVTTVSVPGASVTVEESATTTTVRAGTLGFGGLVSVQTGPASPLPPVVVGAPLAPAPPPPMGEAALVALVQAVRDATFGDDQVDVLRTAAARNRFTCAQVVRLLEPISHSSDKVEAVQALRPAILDPENAHVLEGAFTFSSDKETVRRLFR